MEVLKKVLVEGVDGTRMLFHHSFAEWLLDVKHCTPRFLCSPSEGHAMLALSFTAHASELLPAEVLMLCLCFHLCHEIHIFQGWKVTESRLRWWKIMENRNK